MGSEGAKGANGVKTCAEANAIARRGGWAHLMAPKAHQRQNGSRGGAQPGQ